MHVKLEAKREKRAQQLKIPAELMVLDRDSAKLMQKWRSAEREDPNLDDDQISELLRRILRIEKIVSNVDDTQFTNLLTALQMLSKQLK